MAIRVRYKISGDKPNINKILENLQVLDHSKELSNDIILLNVVLKNNEDVGELLRRLKSKKGRNTKVDIIAKEQILDNNFSYCKERVMLRNVGFKHKLTQRHASFYIGISKIIVIGNNLEKGQNLYNYSGEDQFGRSVLMIYLDGKPRNESREINMIEYNTFIEKQSDMLKKVARQARKGYSSFDNSYGGV